MNVSKRTLIVMPDDGIQPLQTAIGSARRSIEIKMFLFSEPRLVNAVVEAHKRDVKTRVMLNPARRSGESDNDDTHNMLARAGGVQGVRRASQIGVRSYDFKAVDPVSSARYRSLPRAMRST